MTDRKISELVAVTTVEDTDEFVVARAGVSNKITGANLATSVGGGGGSPAGSLSLLGPYPIAYDDAGLQGDGLRVGEFLDAGTVVHGLIIDVSTPFASITQVLIGVEFGVMKGVPANFDTRMLAIADGAQSSVMVGAWSSPGALTSSGRTAVITDSGIVKLYALVLVDGDPAVSGAADVYAVVSSVA